MITLITAGPGMGKTALAVSMLLDEYKGRPIFSNVNSLTLEHSPLPKIEEWTSETINQQGTAEHKFTFPPGSIVVIDECQHFFRPRASGSKVPPYVQAFETHRHAGIDFVLITQGTRLIDFNLRSLIKGGRHIYLHQSFFKRYRLERNECIDEDDKTSRSLASRRKYTLPAHVFPLYKSSELHTKPARAKLPIQFYIFIAALIAIVAIGAFLYQRMDKKFESPEKPPVGDTGPAQPGQGQPMGFSSYPATTTAPARIQEAMTPSDDHNPLSAPLYAAVLPPVVAPEVQGCIASKRACACYNQQQTPVWMPDEQCRKRAAGLYFDPYRQPPTQREPAETMPETTAVATAAVKEVPPAPASEMPSSML